MEPKKQAVHPIWIILLLVVVFIAFGVPAPWLRYSRREGMRNATLEILQMAVYTIEVFRAEHGRLPSTEELYSTVADRFVKGGGEGLKDPYTGAYLAYSQDESSPRGYRIASVGPDHVAGTDDDICLDNERLSRVVCDAAEWIVEPAAYAVEMFRDRHGRLPTVEEFASPPVTNYTRGGSEGLRDPFSGKWLRYWHEEALSRGYGIASCGPDGRPGTKDDIYLKQIWPCAELDERTDRVLEQATRAVEGFREEHGRLPSLDELYSPQVDAHVGGGWEQLADPYTRGRLRYWADDESTRGFCLASSGPDGVPETDDDILLDEAVER